VETADLHSRVLWQADEPALFADISSVRLVDLDGDDVPEILSLWWNAASAGAELRVFHWDRDQKSFVELQLEDEPSGVLSYQLVRAIGARRSTRIAVNVLADRGSRRSAPGGEFEMRGAKLVRVAGGGTLPSQGGSGIEGQAVISPVHPGPVREGQTNTAPYKTTIVVWKVSDGSEVARIETGSDGRFRVAVPPGIYKVGPAPETRRFLPRGVEETLTVAQGKFTHVTINFDSGMR
jgi:hypothetical protein